MWLKISARGLFHSSVIKLTSLIQLGIYMLELSPKLKLDYREEIQIRCWCNPFLVFQ